MVKKNTSKYKKNPLKNAAFAIVIIIWAIAMLVDIFGDLYSVSLELYGLVALVIGYFAGSRLKK